MAAMSFAVSVTSSDPSASARRSRRRAPMNGMMSSPCRATHAIATCAVPFENTALSGQVVRDFEQCFTGEQLGIEYSVEVGGVAQSTARQQGIPGDHAAALPSTLAIKSLRLSPRRDEHQA